jgi:hypothetical protein
LTGGSVSCHDKSNRKVTIVKIQDGEDEADPMDPRVAAAQYLARNEEICTMEKGGDVEAIEDEQGWMFPVPNLCLNCFFVFTSFPYDTSYLGTIVYFSFQFIFENKMFIFLSMNVIIQ